MNAKLLLFDIDGTLLLTRGAGRRAMRRAGQQLFGADFRFEVDTSGKLDTQIYAELAEQNPQYDMAETHAQLRERYVSLLNADLNQNNLAYALPGVMGVLETLQTFDVTLGLLTGNYGPSAALKLRTVNIDPDLFPITVFGDEATTRPDLPPLALQKYQTLTGKALQPRQVVVIGDTPRDVECAHANGCRAVAVATGRYSAEALRATGADLVLNDLSEPAPLLKFLHS